MNQDFLGKMTNGEKAILGGSLLVLIFLFFPWYGWEVVSFGFFGGVSQSFNGFYGWGWLTFLALLAVIAFWVIRTFLADDVKLPELPVPDPAVYMILGGVEVLGTVLYWASTGPSINTGYSSQGVKYGLFIALIGGVITIVGGYLEQSEPQATASIAGGAGGGSAPAPPPSFTPAAYTPPQPPQPEFTTPPPPPTGPPSAPPPPSAPTAPPPATPPESTPPES